MMVTELPKIGDRIPIKNFHVSKLNVRAGEEFGKGEEDQRLIANLRHGKIIGPFKARLEGNGYGVFVGRRRFLARKTAGAKSFIVGVDCLVEDVSEAEAREASLTENLEVLRKTMDPVTRAKQLNEIISFSSEGLRGTARRLGIPASNLSEWLKILELSPKMQEAVAEGFLGYTEAMKLARMRLGVDLQDKLVEVLKNEGADAFWKELNRLSTDKMKRGIPRGVYKIDRIMWDKRNRKEIGCYEIVRKVAQSKGMKTPDYIKDFVRRHIDEIKQELT
jgi:ParB-like chromosome segregation protein Spo0J